MEETKIRRARRETVEKLAAPEAPMTPTPPVPAAEQQRRRMGQREQVTNAVVFGAP